MIKLSCMTLPYKKYSFERALEGIARAGYKYIAFGHPHEGMEYPNARDEHTVERIQAVLNKYKLQPTLLCSNQHFKIDQPIERAIERMHLAKAFGIKELLTIGTQSYRSFPDDERTEEEMVPFNQAFVERYKRIAEIASELDLVITIKPHTGNTATAAHMMRTLQQIGSPNIQGSYDPGNVQFYEGVVAATDFPQMIDRNWSFVAKDHRGARANFDFPVPGTGDVDFSTIFSAMKRAGFDGNVAIERVDGLPEVDLIDQRLGEARIQVERMLREAGFELA